MADYSWVDVCFKSTDPEILKEVEERIGGTEMQTDNMGLEWMIVGAETAYGLAEDAETFLTERKIPWIRTSDGKYEFDGDEAHWKPGMDGPRVFSRLNNEGRVLTNAEVRALEDKTDAELGAYVREHFAFSIEGGDDE